jgi:flagellar biosynthesis GTPase FlhF
VETKRFIGSDLTRLYDRVKRDLGPDAVIVRTRSLLREGAEPLIEIVVAPPDSEAELSLDLQRTLVEGALHRVTAPRPVTIGDLEDQVAREAMAEFESLVPMPQATFETPPLPDWLLGFVSDAPAAPFQALERDPGDLDAGGDPAGGRPRRRSLAPLPDEDPDAAPSPEWATRARPEIVTRRRARPAARAHSAPGDDDPAAGDMPLKFQPVEPGIATVLTAAGLSEAAARVVARSPYCALEPHEAVANVVADRLSRYPDEGQTALITIEGPAGSGRTTALMRMALDCADAGRPALLVAADSGHVGAREQVHAYGDAIGIDVVDAFEAGELARIVARARPGTCIFADVPAGEWTAPLQAAGQHYRYLALPANWQREAYERTIGAARGGEAAGWVLTFADITTNLTPVLSLVLESPLGIAFLSSGRDVSSGIGVVDALTLASGIFTIRRGDTTNGRLVATA